jgi:uncharacterized membrane protein
MRNFWNWRAIALLLLAIGIGFRFVNLDRKVYWHDEVYTSLRVSGYTGEEVGQQLFNGEIVSPTRLLDFQTPSPDKTFSDTANSLARHPEHPPLYYGLVWGWWKLFEPSVVATRGLSAIISLFVFPSLYWWVWELMRSPRVAWFAIALVAISPFHVLYAEEARQYSLWTVAILLSSASLLRAIRLNRIRDWAMYSITLALNFYTFLLSAFVAISHGIYAVVIAIRQRQFQILWRFVLSGAIALLLFSPWIAILIARFSQFQDKTYWTTVDESFADLATQWTLHLSSIFIDLHPTVNTRIALFLLPILILAIAFSIYRVFRQESVPAGLLISLLILIPALGLILPDLILGGRRSSMSRYFIPCYLGIQLAVAYCIAGLTRERHRRSRQFGQIIFALLIASSIASNTISANAETWWNKVVSYNNSDIAKIVNTSDRPLIISHDYDINLGNLISLAYELDSEIEMLLLPSWQIPPIPDRFGNIFAYNPSPKMRSRLERQTQATLTPIDDRGARFWQLQLNSPPPSPSPTAD